MDSDIATDILKLSLLNIRTLLLFRLFLVEHVEHAQITRHLFCSYHLKIETFYARASAVDIRQLVFLARAASIPFLMVTTPVGVM